MMYRYRLSDLFGCSVMRICSTSEGSAKKITSTMPSLVFIHTARSVDANIAMYVESCTDIILSPDWLNTWINGVEKAKSVGITIWVGCMGIVVSVRFGDTIGFGAFVQEVRA